MKQIHSNPKIQINTWVILSTFVLGNFLFSCGNKGGDLDLIPVKAGNEYQYIDKEGKIVINPQFSKASVFRDDLALIRTSGENPQWGFIDKTGKIIIPANYLEATIFSEGIAWVTMKNAAPTAVNKKGEILFSLQDAEEARIFKDGLAAYKISDSTGAVWGFVDKEGQVKINPQFNACGNFSEKLCAVENKDKKWGYIDEKGAIIINPQFDQAFEFKNDRAIVIMGGKVGVIDLAGKFVVNPQFSGMDYDEGKFLIVQDSKFGWCDMDGKIIINPQFSGASSFNKSTLAAVESGEKWGYIDAEGKIKINPQFDKAFPFAGNLALVYNSDKYGMIDQEGKFIINPQFDEIPDDLVRFISDGSSSYESVSSDFFNVEKIIGVVDFTKPAGLVIGAPVSSAIEKVPALKENLNEYRGIHDFMGTVKITNEASYEVKIVANPFSEITEDFYTKKVLNPSAPINGVRFEISLSGKGLRKGKDLLEALQKKLIAYKRDDQKSTQSQLVYTNDKTCVQIGEEGYTMVITVSDLATCTQSNEQAAQDLMNASKFSDEESSSEVPAEEDTPYFD